MHLPTTLTFPPAQNDTVSSLPMVTMLSHAFTTFLLSRGAHHTHGTYVKVTFLLVSVRLSFIGDWDTGKVWILSCF